MVSDQSSAVVQSQTTSLTPDPPFENIQSDNSALSMILVPYATPTKEVPTPSTSAKISYYSPEDIMPYPKAAPRAASSGGRNKGRCRILTDNPEKHEIEANLKLKLLKKTEKGPKKCKKRMKAKKILYSSSEENDLSGDFGSSEVGKATFPRIENTIGEYVAVKYDSSVFAGVIVKILKNGVKVKAMQRYGLLWKWPEREDVLFYSFSDVISHLNTPCKSSARREIYSVPELELVF